MYIVNDNLCHIVFFCSFIIMNLYHDDSNFHVVAMDTHFWWYAVKQLRSGTMHNITWHLEHFQMLYPDVHHLQRLRFFSCTGQCATWSYLTSLIGGLVILYFFGGGDSMSAADGLPTALFLLANDSVNIAWNLRRGNSFWLSSLQSLLYKNQELTTVIVKVWKNMYMYHRFDFNNLLYNEHIMSRSSIPPILALYSLIMAGLFMWRYS